MVIFYVSFILCLCLFIDAIWIMYLYNKTDNFLFQKNKEAKELKQRHLAPKKYDGSRDIKDNNLRKLFK